MDDSHRMLGNRAHCRPVLSEGSDGTCLPAMCETQGVHWRSDTAKTQVLDSFLIERERESQMPSMAT